MAKYDLSVAIIFKNEIRCLERCLKSLQPLRERLSLQIVMADTGSDDGSREIATRYADELFDFPWINDFAAARNAVLDRCRGRWVLAIDCDEWLDSDVSELANFVKGNEAKKNDAAMLTIRNYSTRTFDQYTEFNAIRLLNMSIAPRYEGTIHEQPAFGKDINCRALPHTLLHHDGYVMLNDGSKEGRAKFERNLSLLKAAMERDPNNLRTLSQYLDSAVHEQDYLDTLRHAVELSLNSKNSTNQRYSAALLRTAIEYAYNENLSEMEEWGEKAFQIYPDSYFTKIDTTYILFARAHDKKDYTEMIRLGKAYLDACDALEYDMNGWAELRYGVLQRRGEKWTAIVTCCIAESYYYLGQYEKAVSTLEKVGWNALRQTEVRGILVILMSIYSKSDLDLTGLLIRFWDGICEETPNKCIADERKEAFRGVGLRTFSVLDDNTHLSWRMFLPLRGKCILGDAAALLNAETPEEADLILADIDDLTELPPAAFVHALQLGAEFPVPGKTLSTDQIAALAEKLLIDPPFLREAARFAASAAQTEQEVMWAYALAKVALNQATAALTSQEKKE